MKEDKKQGNALGRFIKWFVIIAVVYNVIGLLTGYPWM